MEKNNDLMSGKGEKGKWITVNGSHIFLEDGQSVEDAMDKHFSKEKGKKDTRQHDKYGNPLLDDKSRQVGIDAGKKYIEEITKYDSLDKVIQSNVMPGYLIDKMSEAIHDSGYEDDITTQDFNDMVEQVTGYRFDTDAYESNRGNWTTYFKKSLQPQNNTIDQNKPRADKYTAGNSDNINKATNKNNITKDLENYKGSGSVDFVLSSGRWLQIRPQEDGTYLVRGNNGQKYVSSVNEAKSEALNLS